MKSSEKTFDTILNGKITITQPKNGFRFGFDSVFLAAFVNGYIKKNIRKEIFLSDMGAGVGTVSLILAYHNKNITINTIENNKEYIELAKVNFKNNFPKQKINFIEENIFNIDKVFYNQFDIIVSNPPYHISDGNISKNFMKDRSKRIVDLEKWLEVAVNLLKNKGSLFLIFPTDILHRVLNSLERKTGSYKIFPLWPNSRKSSKRLILIAKKGGLSPTELMPGIKLYNNKGSQTKKAKLVAEKGIYIF